MDIGETHPLKNGTGVLTDYNIISLMLPAAIVGASIGSIFNLILPGPIILALFIVVTTFMAYTGLRKFCELRQSEKIVSMDDKIKIAPPTNPIVLKQK